MEKGRRTLSATHPQAPLNIFDLQCIRAEHVTSARGGWLRNQPLYIFDRWCRDLRRHALELILHYTFKSLLDTSEHLNRINLPCEFRLTQFVFILGLRPRPQGDAFGEEGANSVSTRFCPGVEHRTCFRTTVPWPVQMNCVQITHTCDP